MATQIEGLMNEAMGNLKQMVDVNTIVGDAVTSPDGTTVIPVSKVAFGFGAGGSDFAAKPLDSKEEKPMFGGGCGGGVSVNPVAFLVIKNDNIRLLPVSDSMSTADRIIDMVPDLLSKFNGFLKDIKNKNKTGYDSASEIIKE
ncbi:MAG: GerW family sporulation protein [Clostridia bacterium]|nr:GerW family sporulation protein [Clostridia bacterium]